MEAENKTGDITLASTPSGFTLALADKQRSLNEATRKAFFKCVRANLTLTGGYLKKTQANLIISTFEMDQEKVLWRPYLATMVFESKPVTSRAIAVILNALDSRSSRAPSL